MLLFIIWVAVPPVVLLKPLNSKNWSARDFLGVKDDAGVCNACKYVALVPDGPEPGVFRGIGVEK